MRVVQEEQNGSVVEISWKKCAKERFGTSESVRIESACAHASMKAENLQVDLQLPGNEHGNFPAAWTAQRATNPTLSMHGASSLVSHFWGKSFECYTLLMV
jgi:hypothetical protein